MGHLNFRAASKMAGQIQTEAGSGAYFAYNETFSTRTFFCFRKMRRNRAMFVTYLSTFRTGSQESNLIRDHGYCNSQSTAMTKHLPAPPHQGSNKEYKRRLSQVQAIGRQIFTLKKDGTIRYVVVLRTTTRIVSRVCAGVVCLSRQSHARGRDCARVLSDGSSQTESSEKSSQNNPSASRIKPKEERCKKARFEQKNQTAQNEKKTSILMATIRCRDRFSRNRQN